MYIISNAFKNVIRNRGRNTLMGVIIFAMIVTTVIALIINNTTSSIIDDYKSRFGSEVTITPNMEKLMKQAQENSDDSDESSESKHMKIERPQISADKYIAFGESDYLQKSVYTATSGGVSDDIEPIESEDTSSGNNTMENRGPSLNQESSSGFSPDFKIYGDSWSEFETGDREIDEGKMVANDNECLISSDLASENNISVGDTIKFTSELTDEDDNTVETTYKLKVVGTYLDSTEESSMPMGNSSYTNRRNEILTTFDTVLAPYKSGSEGIEVSAEYYLKDPDMLDDFKAEVKSKGLDDVYEVSTDESSYNKIVAPVESLKSISITFMMIVLALGAIIITLLSTIAIRERKYEIGVLRAMGMKKGKVGFGLWSEMIIITAVCLVLGLGAGALASQPVADILLEKQIAAASESSQSSFGSFEGGPGRGGPGQGGSMSDGKASGMMGKNSTTEESLDSIDVSLDMKTVGEITAISLLLASISAIVSISKITKYEPIKILMERN